MITKKGYITITEFKEKYDLKHNDLYGEVINNFKRDDEFIYYFDYTKNWFKVKIRDVVYIQNIRIAIFNYINNLKKGDVIKFNIYANDNKEKIKKINYKRDKKISSFKTENYLISPENIYFKDILIRDFLSKFSTFLYSVPSLDKSDIRELNKFIDTIK